MVSPVLTENYYAGGFIVSQAVGKQSLDVGTISNSGTTDLVQEAGLVLSRAAGTPAAAVASPANHGNGTVSGISAGAVVQIGDYTLTATAATTFDLTDPDGVNLGTVTAGTAFTSGELNLTVTAGGTAFQAGDTFTVNVPGGNYASYTGAANQPAAAILYGLDYIPASGSKKVTIVSRNAEVNKAELQWDATITGSANVAALQAEALASLLNRGIVSR